VYMPPWVWWERYTLVYMPPYIPWVHLPAYVHPPTHPMYTLYTRGKLGRPWALF